MKIIGESDLCKDRPYAAAVGVFDGMHLGHRFLLGKVKAVADEASFGAMAVTFANHPLEVLRPDSRPLLLTTLDERLKLIDAAGMDCCAVLNFTPEMAAMSARDFMDCYLVGKFNVKTLVVGYDHSFGHDDDTSFEHYHAVGESVGIHVVHAGKCFAPSGAEVSSTAIRHALLNGNMSAANDMLGRMYSVEGVVVHGHRLGTRMGVPTANLSVGDERKLVPAKGVYAAVAHVKGVSRLAVVNIGTRPTVNNGTDITIEAQILDFNADIYGEKMSLEFAERLRDERRFPSVAELKVQIGHDAERAREIMHGKPWQQECQASLS